MTMHILYALFWHMLSELKKKQVKLPKIVNFVQKIRAYRKTLAKYASKKNFFLKFNINAKITHMNVALSKI